MWRYVRIELVDIRVSVLSCYYNVTKIQYRTLSGGLS